jgi:outer membrane protein assembly factor BamB
MTKINKQTLLTYTLITILSLGITAPLVSIVKADTTTTTIPTQLYMTVAPNPIGVGQTTTAVVWLSVAPPEYMTGEYYGWNFTVNVVKPDGTNETLGPFESASTGGHYITFTPKTIGNYTLQAFFPETKITIPKTMTGLMTFLAGNYTFPAAISSAQTLTVQEDPITAWPQTPLPTEYWSYPISAENQDWYTIAGNWLYPSTKFYNAYTTAPNSAHILWTKPLTFGGISGANYSEGNWGVNYYTGLLYENKFKPIIISGNLYANILPSSTGKTGIKCIDIRTGDILWQNESMPLLTCGQVLTLQTGVEGGSMAYLWASTTAGWEMYDAYTGRLLTTFTNVSKGTSLSPNYGPNGEILVYMYSSTGGWLAMWNSTLAVFGSATQFSAMQYSPQAKAIRDWNIGIQWNNTIPQTIGTPSMKLIDYADGVILAEGCLDPQSSNPTFQDYGYSTTTGAQLWQQNRTNMGWGNGGPGSANLFGWSGAVGSGYYTVFERETQQYHVFNIKTGDEAWISEPLYEYTGTDYSYYDWAVQITNGVLLTAGYSGAVVAFNVSTGEHMWTFMQPNAGLQTPFGTWPTFGGSGTVADGKIYWGVTQHSPGTPLFRGYQLYCINFTTGEEIWEMPGFFSPESIAVAGGEVIGYAGYDNQIYAFGKGPSQTTVTAPSTAIQSGQSIIISGTVLDIATGTTDSDISARFPNGVACVSDESQSAWMEYVYMQQERPTNATGVNVELYVLDSNGNYRSIGTTTTDTNGYYSYQWIPDIAGKYTVYAVFSGTNAYYGSQATAAFAVDEAAAIATPQATHAPSAADMYFIPAVAGLFIAVIAVGLLTILVLKKKP